ncbi:5043_t:CDS:2 [Cetraspora pellucida]|uniref:5043_t:CDS:1 n=1 Tax=Cetraspora pellucida TaxID=1433469 RepID=A0A9N9J389_9GLOM|nr:5043_t:CDS:2 [Cetraspora pellucida]
MSAITTKIIEKYNLSSKMEFLENLTDDKKWNQARRRLRDGFKFSSEQVGVLIPNQRSRKNKTINLVEDNCRIAITKSPKSLEEEIVREKAKRILQNRYEFSDDQVNALFTIPKNESRYSVTTSDKNINIVITNQLSKGMEEETIGDMMQWILQNKLSIRDVRVKAYALALSAKNANAGSSHLTRLCRELRNLNASLEIIEVTKFPDITEDANKIQSINWKKAKAKRIDYSDEFTLESVKERLDAYNIKTLPDYQALADVMMMLCQPNIPRKFRSMEKNQERAKELLTWIQHAISSGRMSDLGKPEVKWFNRFLKDYDLIPKYLCKLGAVYGVIAHEAKNMAHAYTIAGECLRHSSDNHTSSVQNYVVVNYRK